MVLKYLFKATYLDGTNYQQNPEDISCQDPKRSCFFDLKSDLIKTFCLEGDGHSYLVDLTDGHFEIDGTSFCFHEHPLTEIKLIYFRRHTHNFNLQFGEQSHTMCFRFGWQAEENGKQIQRIMEIN